MACTTDVGYAHGTVIYVAIGCTQVSESDQATFLKTCPAKKWSKASEVPDS
jgi:hypothetical protein